MKFEIYYLITEHKNGSGDQKADPSKVSPPPFYLSFNSDRVTKLQFTCHIISSSA